MMLAMRWCILCFFVVHSIELGTTNAAPCNINAVVNTGNARFEAGGVILTWLECETAPNNMQAALGTAEYNRIGNKLKFFLAGGARLTQSDFSNSALWRSFTRTLDRFGGVTTVTGSITINCNGDHNLKDDIVRLHTQNILLKPLIVNNDLTVDNCHALSDLTSLKSIAMVKRNVVFTSNNGLISSSGFVANGATTLTVENHPVLEDLDGFAAMTTPTKITIKNNHRLQDGCGLQSLVIGGLVASSVNGNGQNVLGTKKWPLRLSRTSFFSNNGIVGRCPATTTKATTITATDTTTTATSTKTTTTTKTETATNTETVTTITNTGVTATITTSTIATAVTETTMTTITTETTVSTVTVSTVTNTTEKIISTITRTTVSIVNPTRSKFNPTTVSEGLSTTDTSRGTEESNTTTIKSGTKNVIDSDDGDDDGGAGDGELENDPVAIIVPIIAVVVVLLICVLLAWKRRRDEQEAARTEAGNFTVQGQAVFNPTFKADEYSDGNAYLSPTLRKDSDGEYSAVDYSNMERSNDYETPVTQQTEGSSQIYFDVGDSDVDKDYETMYNMATNSGTPATYAMATRNETTYEIATNTQATYAEAQAAEQTETDVLYGDHETMYNLASRDTPATYEVAQAAIQNETNTDANGHNEPMYDTATTQDSSTTYALAQATQSTTSKPKYSVASAHAVSAGSETQPQYAIATSIGEWSESVESQPQYDTASATPSTLQQQLYSLAGSEDL
eukprot:m.339242 g.339242  ORF g.339242 m.339242 type:complete len:736 (-) comp18718_c0_seq1:61-2268(-)